MYYYYNSENARKYGAGSLKTKGYLVLTTTLYGLYMASQMVGQGFVDLLRVGETFSDPSVANAAQDGLRVVSLVAPAFKVFRLGAAVGVSGGSYVSSCGATATSVAARLSGTKVVMRLKDFQEVLKLPVSPKSAAFEGVTPPQMAAVLDAIGAKMIHRVLAGWQDVEAMLDLNKGPVVFWVETIVNGQRCRHAMAAFRVFGETSIADQFGVQSGAAIRGQLAQAKSTFVAGWVVEDSALVHAVNLASGTAASINMPVSTLDHLRSEDLDWLMETLLIPAWIVPSRVLWGLGDLINEQLGRPPFGKSADMSPDAARVLQVTPKGAGKNGLMAQVGSGLSTDRFLAAVAELEEKGWVRAVRGTAPPLGIVSITRIK
jgi:hypothetical protein